MLTLSGRGVSGAAVAAATRDWSGGLTGAQVDDTLAEVERDRVSVMRWIPVAQRAAIRARTSTYDCTAAFQAALDAQVDLYVPTGRYVIAGNLVASRTASGSSTTSEGELPVTIRGAGRGRTKLVFTATTGYGLDIAGTATDLTLQGIVGQSLITGIAFEGPGSTGNTLTAIHAVAFNHLELDQLFLRNFGGDGIYLDRQYYGTGAPVRDDRGAFAKLSRVKANGIGGVGLKAGNSAAFEVDHLYTEHCEFTGCGTWGGQVWAQGWMEVGGVWQGASGGIDLYSGATNGTNYPSLGVVLIGGRCEHSAGVANLRVGKCARLIVQGYNFVSRNIDRAVPFAVILGANSGDNITQAFFYNCFFNSDASGGCFSVAPNGGASVNCMVFGGGISASYTSQVTNATSQIMSLFADGAWDQPTGWSTPLRAVGVSGGFTATFGRRGEAQPRVRISGADSAVQIGPGVSTAASQVLGQRVTGFATPHATRDKTLVLDPATSTLSDTIKVLNAFLAAHHSAVTGAHGSIGT